MLDEFNELEFNNINLDEIQDKIKEADNLDQIKEVLVTTINHLNSEEIGVLDKLQEINRFLNKLSNSSDRINIINSRIQIAIEELNAISSDSESILSDIEDSFENIEDLRNIQDKIYSLQNKHRVNKVEDLLKIKNDIESKISVHNNIDSDIIEIENKISSLNLSLMSDASKIHQKKRICNF